MTNFHKKRSEAIAWWNTLSILEQMGISEEYFNNRLPATGREIETIYLDYMDKITDEVFGDLNKNAGTQRSPFGIGS